MPSENFILSDSETEMPRRWQSELLSDKQAMDVDELSEMMASWMSDADAWGFDHLDQQLERMLPRVRNPQGLMALIRSMGPQRWERLRRSGLEAMSCVARIMIVRGRGDDRIARVMKGLLEEQQIRSLIEKQRLSLISEPQSASAEKRRL